jgi:hypothetical protein
MLKLISYHCKNNLLIRAGVLLENQTVLELSKVLSKTSNNIVYNNISMLNIIENNYLSEIERIVEEKNYSNNDLVCFENIFLKAPIPFPTRNTVIH